MGTALCVHARGGSVAVPLQTTCSFEAHPSLTAFLKVWDDREIESIFVKYQELAGTDQESASLSAEKLQIALQELGVNEIPVANTTRTDLSEFKRIARLPSEAEQWAQKIPLAGMLVHSLSPAKFVGLNALAKFTDEEIDRGTSIFRDCLCRLVKDKIRLLKEAIETNIPCNRDQQLGFIPSISTIATPPPAMCEDHTRKIQVLTGEHGADCQKLKESEEKIKHLEGEVQALTDQIKEATQWLKQGKVEAAVVAQDLAWQMQALTMHVEAEKQDQRETDLALQMVSKLSEKILKLYDDIAVGQVFEKHLDAGEDTLKPQRLLDALLDLDVVCHDCSPQVPLTLDEFKRIARQPSEAEKWIHMIPLAGLMARAFGKKHSDGLENLQPDEMSSGLLAFCEGVKMNIKERLRKLKDQEAKLRGIPNGTSTFGGFLEASSIDDIFHGISDRLGYPHPQIEKGIRDEHCEVNLGCNIEFTTTNHRITTTPNKEYQIASDPDQCPEEDKFNEERTKKIRKINKADELVKLDIAKQAELKLFEVKSIVLYSGPMYEVYNTMLRQPTQRQIQFDLYEKFKAKDNYFSTTIHVLVSATVKLARAFKLPSGLKLYRGIGKELLEVYENEFGRNGYMEWGFMSTTSNENIARQACMFLSFFGLCDLIALPQNSGANDGTKIGMVFCLEATSIDRAAFIREFSQYPQEVEYLHVPCSFVEPTGLKRLEETKTNDENGQECTGLLWMIHIQININLKSFTVEELKGRKKELHLAAFKYILSETKRDLWGWVEELGAESRLKNDGTGVLDLEIALGAGGSKEQYEKYGLINDCKVHFTIPALIQKLLSEGKSLWDRHANLAPEEYAKDEVYSGLVKVMLTYRIAASSAVRGYCEDQGAQIQYYMMIDVFQLHQDYLGLLWRALPPLGQVRRPLGLVGSVRPLGATLRMDHALRLCKLMGLVRQTVDEIGDDGNTPLKRAAKLGAGERSLQLLVAAGADLNPDGSTPLKYAAQNGHVAAIEAMVKLGADPNKKVRNGATPMYFAAEKGQTATIEALGRLGADPTIARNDGATPMHIAASNGHTAAIEALARLEADFNKAINTGGMPGCVTEISGKVDAELLHKFGADLIKSFKDGTTAVFLNAPCGLAEVIKTQRFLNRLNL